MNNIFPFVNLKSFPNGWKWHGKLREFIKIKYYESLKKIDDNKIGNIAAFLNGSVLNFKLFEIFNWVLYFNPVPSLEIYFICERNEKKGDSFNIFFGKNSNDIPIEEIYGFALIYLVVLSLAGKKNNFLSNILKNEEFISLSNTDLNKNQLKSLIYNKCSAIDFNNKKIIDKIEKYPIITDYTIKNKNIEFIVKPFQNMYFKFNFSENGVDIFVTKESFKFYPENLVVSMAGLLCSSIKREYSN